MISRRSFLFSASAAAVSAALPIPQLAAAVAPAAEPIFIGLDLASGPDMMAFIVGTPGEFDWEAVFATNIEEAWQAYVWEHDYLFEDLPEGVLPEIDHERVQRVAAWDALEGRQPTPKDWIKAGLGHTCDRCNEGAHPNWEGVDIIGDEVVCGDCQYIPDWVAINRERALDELVNLIADSDSNAVRDRLKAQMWDKDRSVWDFVPADLWDEAVAAVGEI